MNLFAGWTIGRVFGISVTISWLFMIYAGYEIVNASDQYPDSQHASAIEVAVINILATFGLVLLHEFGHCFACRWVKGRADTIVLWPLGGLAFCQPPDRPMPQLITTVGGPMVNVLFLPITWLLTQSLPYLQEHMTSAAFFEAIFYFVFFLDWVNKVLLVFNLLPIYPLDGGRIFQEILWFFVGYQKSLQIAGMVGTVGGVGLVYLGLGLTRITIPWVALSLGGYLNLSLVAIGIFAAQASFAAYQRAIVIAATRRR